MNPINDTQAPANTEHAVVSLPKTIEPKAITIRSCFDGLRERKYTDGPIFKIKWGEFASDLLTALWTKRDGERRRILYARRLAAFGCGAPLFAYALASHYYGETSPAKLFALFKPEKQQKRPRGRFGYRGEEVDSKDGKSSIAFDHPGDNPGVSELQPTQPAVASLAGIKGEDFAIRVDGAKVDPLSDDYVIDSSDDSLSILPSCGYWTVGRHRIEISTDSKSGPKARLLFDVKWHLDFSESVPKELLDINNPVNVGGRVYLDSDAGALLLEPPSRDDNNPTYCTLSRFIKQMRPYSVGFKLRVQKNRSAAIQVVLPGQVAVQLLDAGSNCITVKQRNKYLAKDRKSLTKYRKRAASSDLPSTLEWDQETWIWISWDGLQIVVSSGSQGQTELCRITLLKSEIRGDDLSFALRSYGSVVSVSALRVQRFLSVLND